VTVEKKFYQLVYAPDPDNELRAWSVCERLGFDLWISDEPLGEPKDHFLAKRITEYSSPETSAQFHSEPAKRRRREAR